MDFLNCAGTFAAILTCTSMVTVHATSHLSPSASNEDWQTRRLMAPTPSQLAAESKGQVFIYDSLDINRVDSAMDQNFDRIQNMMFIRIHHLPPTGSGPAVVEDDDC